MANELVFDPAVRPVYAHLEPIVDLLLKGGNKLALPYRWGENRTGYFCFLEKPIDFTLIESAFLLPPPEHATVKARTETRKTANRDFDIDKRMSVKKDSKK